MRNAEATGADPDGTRAAAPLTWAQLMKWLEYQNSPPAHRHRFNAPRFLPVPSGTRLETVQAAVDALVERHEALRTTFDLDEHGDPFQLVHPPSRLALERVEAPEDLDPMALAEGPAAHLTQRPVVLEQEWPIRAAAILRNGQPRGVLLVIHYLAIDAWSLRVLATEFATLVRDLSGGRAPSLQPAPHQPRDEAAYERSPAGQRASAAALRYWERQLLSMPHRTFPTPPDADGEHRRAVLSSPALIAATRELALREQASEPSVALAAFAMLLAHYTGSKSCVMTNVAANRTRRTVTSVGTYIQPTLAIVELEGDPTFAEVVRRTTDAGMKAYRHAHCDYAAMRALHARCALGRGVRFDWQVVVNSRLIEAKPRRTSAQPSARAGSLLDRTRLTWEPVPPGTPCGPGLTLFIGRDAPEGAPAPIVELYTYTALVPAEHTERLLASLEALLVAAADGAAPRLSELGKLVDLDPLPVPSGWRLIDNCLVDVDEVRRAVLACPGVDACAIAVEERDGRASLVAYVASGDGSATPGTLRRAMLDRLTAQPSLMVPHWYTLCEQPPPDPTDVHAWQEQPVVASDPGTVTGHTPPDTAEEKALCDAIAQVHGLEPVNTASSYVLAGGRVERVPAVQRRLLQSGYVGLALDHFCSPSTIGQLATRLFPLSQVGDLSRLGLSCET